MYALLVNQRWFRLEALAELWDAGLHSLRAEACGVIAKELYDHLISTSILHANQFDACRIETEDDPQYLLHAILLRRYSFIVNGEPTTPVNVVEKAVDLHSVRVIGSSGYQKCISYLWSGWLIQDENDPSVFVDYKNRDNPNFFTHMDPDRMRAPRYQNAAQLLFSLIYLALYTAAINSVNAGGVFDGAEVALYVFTLGFICDEVVKFYKAGYQILGFWNAFNGLLYSFLTISFVVKVVGLMHDGDSEFRKQYTQLSYNLLAFIAPMFWSRLLLYLDSFRFFGAMLVVLKVMMKESMIFFALLVVVIIGFLQAFIGLDITENNVIDDVPFIIESMLKAIMQSPEFEGFESFGHPFGIILYYCFTFVVMVCIHRLVVIDYILTFFRLFSSTSSSLSTTPHTKTFTKMPTTNTLHSLPRKRCNLFALQMRTYTLLL